GDAGGGVVGHGDRGDGAAAQAAAEVAVGERFIEAEAAEPGAEIEDVEIGARRDEAAAAARLPIGDEALGFRPRRLRPHRLATDADPPPHPIPPWDDGRDCGGWGLMRG